MADEMRFEPSQTCNVICPYMSKEPAKQEESIALYQYLCEKIVGTEKNVKTLRMMNAVKDHLANDKTRTLITGGSFGEGLEMRGSDIDFIKVMKIFRVCDNISLNPDKNYFTMETSETQPGFTQLRLTHAVNSIPLFFCKKIRGEYYLSNTYIKQHFHNEASPIVHGPCLSDKNRSFDFAFCLHSKSWIPQAQQWITRSKNEWPGYYVKQSIITHGVLFAPKGVPGSIKEHLEWRISFSVGEKLLIYTFLHTQLLCYALMKIILKDVIETDLECKKLLCSYFLKTILFWISEEWHHTIWKPANLICNFMRCLRRLTYCVEHSVCPHYFIPDNNLFEYKIRGHAQKILSEKLKTLTNYGWRCIFLSSQINELAINREAVPVYEYGLKLLLSHKGHVTDACIQSEPPSLKNIIHMILSFESSKIKYLYSFYMSKACRSKVQVLSFDSLYGNKSAFKNYKTCLSTVLLSTRDDAVSGWLTVASFFYQSKQYKKALAILQYSLLKCSPEKLFIGINLSHIHYEIFSLRLIRQMTIARLSKYLLVDEMWFLKTSTLLPKELLIEEMTPELRLPPVVYAHFLRFLCHYHLKNILKCQHSLEDLELTIEEDFFVANYVRKAHSYNLLGIIFQLSGKKESAQQTFMKSIKLVSDPDGNSAFQRLSNLNAIK